MKNIIRFWFFVILGVCVLLSCNIEKRWTTQGAKIPYFQNQIGYIDTVPIKFSVKPN